MSQMSNPVSQAASTPQFPHVYVATVEYCKFTACADESQHIDVATISEDGLTLKVDIFTARISHDLPGRLVIDYEDPTNGQIKHFYRVLRDGTFEFITGDKPNARWRYISGVDELLASRFGITKYCHQTPNCDFQSYSRQHEGADGKHYLSCVVSDGMVRTILLDDDDEHFNPHNSEDLFFYDGKVRYNVHGATWAIICEATLDSDSSIIEKNITLYTQHSNAYLLALELDQYLCDHDHGNFDDYLGELKDLI